MPRTLIFPLAVILVIAAAPLLSGCNTTAGAGQDIAAGGRAIEKTAKQATP